MEGPSLFLAAEQLQSFVGKHIEAVGGNTSIAKERLLGKKIVDIFSWGKHLVLQFDDFALRIHFMLFGSFEATYEGKKVTGDYPRKNRPIRLQIKCPSGEIDLYSASLQFIENAHAKELYDFTIDIMSPLWDPKKALKSIKQYPEQEIADLLLDQTLFAGVGNIIKNESLFLARMQPTKVAITTPSLKKLIEIVHAFSHQFYEWRKVFELKKHYQVYRQSKCPLCGGKITKKWTGLRHRVSYYCPSCQKE